MIPWLSTWEPEVLEDAVSVEFRDEVAPGFLLVIRSQAFNRLV